MAHLQRTPPVTVSFNLNAELPYKKLMKKPFWRNFVGKNQAF